MYSVGAVGEKIGGAAGGGFQFIERFFRFGEFFGDNLVEDQAESGSAGELGVGSLDELLVDFIGISAATGGGQRVGFE